MSFSMMLRRHGSNVGFDKYSYIFHAYTELNKLAIETSFIILAQKCRPFLDRNYHIRCANMFTFFSYA